MFPGFPDQLQLEDVFLPVSEQKQREIFIHRKSEGGNQPRWASDIKIQSEHLILISGRLN